MRLFHRTHISPADALALADQYFAKLGLNVNATSDRARTFSGPLGTMTLSAKPEGGHYTFIEVVTDQIGESRLDKNVKKYFVEVHRRADPQHVPTAGY